MSKPDLEDIDIINIVQLAAKKESAEALGESEEKIEKEIIKRMSEKALNWYLNNIVPVAGRPNTKAKWEKIRNNKQKNPIDKKSNRN